MGIKHLQPRVRSKTQKSVLKMSKYDKLQTYLEYLVYKNMDKEKGNLLWVASDMNKTVSFQTRFHVGPIS